MAGAVFLLQWTKGSESNPGRGEAPLASVVVSGVVTEEGLVSIVGELASNYRDRSAQTDELVLVLPRWMWDMYGQERLTASFRRVGVQHVQLVGDWSQEHAIKPQLLLYAAGTWHANHHVGQTSPDCEGCQYAG